MITGRGGVCCHLVWGFCGVLPVEGDMMIVDVVVAVVCVCTVCMVRGRFGVSGVRGIFVGALAYIVSLVCR